MAEKEYGNIGVTATAPTGVETIWVRQGGVTKDLALSSLPSGTPADDSITNAKLANMADGTVKGRALGAGTGDPTDLTAAQVATITQGTGSDASAAGFRGVPPNSQSGNYTTVLADSGRDIVHPSGGGAGDTYTIAANASVAYPLGTVIGFVNLDSNSVSIAIASDTLTWAPSGGAGSTGTRTLAQNGQAVAKKVSTTGWLLSGTGIS